MTVHFSAVQSLRRVFQQGFAVQDIAESLVSFDANCPAEEVGRFMDANRYEVVGVREGGLVTGYVTRQSLGHEECSAYIRHFQNDEVIFDTASLTEAVIGLKDRCCLFVSSLGGIAGIITRSDMQKPPVRMWLFGMITLIEMNFTRLIEQCCPNNQWREHLSEGRLQKAEELLAERTRRNQHLNLLDCLQFADKGQIVAKHEPARSATRFSSRRQVEQLTKDLERLRNNLAHAQDIVSEDWEMIVMLAENLERVLVGPPGLKSDNGFGGTLRDETPSEVDFFD